MQLRGPLMVEHRVIERVVGAMSTHLATIEAGEPVGSPFLDAVVDFLRVYSDRTHHGKEEEILFQRLREKQLTAEDERLLEELLDEHAVSRATVSRMAEAHALWRAGDPSSLAVVADCLRTLTNLYPAHIAKEDKVFFPAAQTYFSAAEKAAILAEYQAFDAGMIHEKYRAVARELGGE